MKQFSNLAFVFAFQILLTGFQSNAQSDTTHVLAIDGVDMTWYGGYRSWAVFPDGSENYRKIIMHYTMGCATGGCSDWDYTTMIRLLHPTGVMDSTIASIDTLSTEPIVVDTLWNVFEVRAPFELGRVITPYGGQLPGSWTQDFWFDVTDFAYMLRDSVEMEAFYSGWSAGFKATISFDFISGTPPREVLEIQNLYSSGTYQNSAQFEQNVLPPREVNFPSGPLTVHWRNIITGHGFDNNVFCAEFCPRDYHLLVNNSNAQTYTIWNDDCGWNPLFPQAGTWLYDRAGWCPGGEGTIHLADLTSLITPGASHTLNMNMQNFSWTGTQAPFYEIASQLIIGQSPNFAVDVEVEEILAPSKRFAWSRFNPVCRDVRIQIRNVGGNALTACQLLVSVDGNEVHTHNWQGNLAFLESEEVSFSLPGHQLWMDGGEHTFSVVAALPNGQTDENPVNNTLSQVFSTPPVYQEEAISIWFRPNNFPGQNQYWVRDVYGNTVFYKNGAGLTPGVTYRDTLYLPAGCYTFEMTDSNKDGLTFFANNAGSGSISFRRLPAGIIRSFNSNFGSGIIHHFVMDNEMVNVEEMASFSEGVLLYPNPTREQVQVALEQWPTGQVNWRLYSIEGRIASAGSFVHNGAETVESISLTGLSKGIYFMELQTGEFRRTRKLIIE